MRLSINWNCQVSRGRRWSQALAVAIVHGRQAAELDWAQYDRLSSEDVWELYQEEVGGENIQRLILLGLQPNSYVVSRPGGELLCYGNLMGIWMVNYLLPIMPVWHIGQHGWLMVASYFQILVGTVVWWSPWSDGNWKRREYENEAGMGYSWGSFASPAV